jgi:hypothetical protein
VSVVLPDDLTTKLNAVNVLLQSIGESPVASLDTSLSVDVAAAVQTLDEITRSFQTKGWHWNREDALTLAPDVNGNIQLPANYLWVANAYWSSTGAPCRVAERARMLYDRDNHTAIFTDSVDLDLVVKLEWEEMPEYARQYITIAAARQLQARLQGSSIVNRVTEDEVNAALALAEQREDEADEANSIVGNRFTQNVLGDRGVRRRQ